MLVANIKKRKASKTSEKTRINKNSVHTEQPPNGYKIAVICVETFIVSTA